MEIIGYSICNDSVTGIVTTCRAGADMGGSTKDIDEFALACKAVLVRAYKGSGNRVDASIRLGVCVHQRPAVGPQEPKAWSLVVAFLCHTKVVGPTKSQLKTESTITSSPN